METRIGVIGIVVEDLEVSGKINEILHEYNHLVVGRMGIPYKQKGVSVISVVVDGSNDEIGSLSGKLGSIKGVNVKTALSKKVYL